MNVNPSLISGVANGVNATIQVSHRFHAEVCLVSLKRMFRFNIMAAMAICSNAQTSLSTQATLCRQMNVKGQLYSTVLRPLWQPLRDLQRVPALNQLRLRLQRPPADLHHPLALQHPLPLPAKRSGLE